MSILSKSRQKPQVEIEKVIEEMVLAMSRMIILMSR